MTTTKRQQKALRETCFDLFSQPWIFSDEKTKKETLPTVPELYMLFDQFNHQYFGGSLPRVKIIYSGRMLNAGSYTPSQMIIKLGKKYHTIFPEEVEDTLKHEMIHILYPSHDSRFKAVASAIGASLKAQSHPDLRGSYKYLYVCPSCGKEYHKRKRLRLAYCGICARSDEFRPEFKLKLIETKKK